MATGSQIPCWPEFCCLILQSCRRCLCDQCRNYPSEECTNETPAYDRSCARHGVLCRAGQRRRAYGDAQENQGNRRDHHRLPRLVDPVFLSRRQPEADRICDRYLLQDRGRGEEGAQARQARGRIQSRDVVDPHSIAGQRYHRSRMWIDHQQCRPPEAGFLHQHPLPDRDPLRLQEVKQDQLDRRSQGQVGGLGINIIPAKEHAESFLMVETDRAVAAVLDDILLASFVAGSKEPDAYVISSDAFSKPEPYGIMMRKDDPAFKKVVDGATAALYQSGEGQKLYDKWFTQKIPPKGLNLNAPISAELRHEFAVPSDSPDPDSYKAM